MNLEEIEVPSHLKKPISLQESIRFMLSLLRQQRAMRKKD